MDDEDVMLSTADNPYNPFTNFDEWNAYDTQMGYYTCAYLARVCKTSDELSELDNNIAITQAINDIVELNLLGNYIKIKKEDATPIDKQQI